MEILMELRDLGPLFLVGFHGASFTHEVRDLIDDLNPSGVILFSRNIEDPVQTARLNRDIQRHATRAAGPGLFIAVDQEGGRVRRLREPFSIFPPALELAAAESPGDAVAQCAEVTARELRLAGFNLDFAPVLDVLDSEMAVSSSVIGDRSFGSDPAVVSRLGRIVIETMRAQGVIPCGKHFPGHGGTLVDSHVELPVDGRSLEDLLRRDLIPFQDLVELNAEMIMTAHVLYPDLDPVHPATLSSAVLGGLLRGRIGYQGIVITDDLEMGAVARKHSVEESSVRAFAAGADILLVCNAPDKAISARAALYDAVRQGQIPSPLLERSLQRIDDLKRRFASSFAPCDETAARAYFA